MDEISANELAETLGYTKKAIETASALMRSARPVLISCTLLESQVLAIRSRLLEGCSVPEHLGCFAQRALKGLLGDDCVSLDVTTTEAGDLVFVARVAGVLKELGAALGAND